MIKKTILMLLVLVGGVVSANADEVTTKRVWLNLTETNSSWTTAGAVTAIHYGSMDWNTHNLMKEIYMYGKKWCYYDVPSTITTIVFKRCGYNDDNLNYWNWQSVDITWSGTDDLYLKLTEGDNIGYSTLSAPSWNNLTCRNNIKDTWTWTASNTEKDGDTFTYTLTSEEIKNFASYETQGIRFRLYTDDYVNFNEAGSAVNGKPQIYPTSPTLDNGQGKTYGEQLDIAGKTFTYYENTDNTDWYWQINVPTYDFSKIVITAKYIYDNGYKWQISADAYISKTLAHFENTYIGTFGSAANVDFSNVEGLTAKKLKVSAGTIVETNATTLFGGEGALLTAESAGPFSIPVASSASADTDNNDLVAITEKVQLAQEPETGYTAYVLTNKKADGTTGPLAFYKVNSKGTWCAAGTAYLKVAQVAAPGAPDFISFGEITGIGNVSHEAVTNNQYYTLDGRRVVQPTKGLYIVNGKKVIVK